MKKILVSLLTLFMISSLSATVLLQQGFEGTEINAWGYTLSHPATTSNNPYARWEPDNELDDPSLPGDLKPLPDNGEYVFNAENTSGLYPDALCSVLFNTIDLSEYSGDLSVSFYYYTFNYNELTTGSWSGGSDVLNYYIEYDNGSNWDTPIALNMGSNEWVKISINVPESSSHVRLKIEVRNDHWEEIGAFDLVTLESTGTPSPITLADFTAKALSSGIQLNWTTESEKENLGFKILRDGEIIAFVEGAGSSTETNDYSYLDNNVIPGKSYTYSLADVAYDNSVNILTQEISINALNTSVNNVDFELTSAYPNPFNPSTSIDISLNIAEELELNIYNTKGQKVTTLFKGSANPGLQHFTWDAQNMQSGVYILKASTSRQIETQKLLLVK